MTSLMLHTIPATADMPSVWIPAGLKTKEIVKYSPKWY